MLCGAAQVVVFGAGLPVPSDLGAGVIGYAARTGGLRWPLGQDPQGNWAGDAAFTPLGAAPIGVVPLAADGSEGPELLAGDLPACVFGPRPPVGG